MLPKYPLATCTLVFAALAAPALAQAPSAATEPEADYRTADVRARANLRGDVEITISGEDFEIGPEALGAMVRKALGCDWHGGKYGSGVCRKFLASEITRVGGRLDLAPLVTALRKAGAATVGLTLDAQGESVQGPSPAWKKRVYKSSAPLIHYQRNYYSFTSRTDTELPPAFLVRMGEAWKPARLAGPFLFVLTGPVLLALWLRRRGGRKGASGFATVWLNWILLGAWLYWISAISLTDVVGFALCLHLQSMVATLLIGVAVYAVPPLAAMASCVLILAMDREEDAEAGHTRMLRRLLAQQAAIVVPLGLFLVGAAMFEHDQTVSMTSLPAAYVTYRILSWLAARLSRTGVQNLESGDLYQRVVSIASLAGAKLKGVHVLGSRLTQEINAYATSTGHIMLTRGLVERLTRRETDSVVAHEAGHLSGKHVGVQTMFFWGYFVVVGPAAAYLLGRSGLPAWVQALPIAPLLYVVAVAQISQRHEFSADARAVRITGDPEAMIAALSRLTKLTRSPVDWGGIQGSILSHPSMKKRALAIADQFSLPHERALAVLDDPDAIAAERVAPALPVSRHYPLPPELEGRPPIFNASARANHVFWCSWGTRVALVIMLGAMGVLAQRLVWDQFRAVRLFFACVPLAAWLYLRMNNSWDRMFRKALKRRIGQRLQPDRDAVFVGLLPGDRVYPIEGSYDWDLGFLSLTPDWLTYTGERARFSMARSAVIEIAVRKGPAAWDRTHAVVVKHGGGAFILRRPDAGYSQRQARKLQDRLDGWRRGQAMPNQTDVGHSPLPPPSLPVFRPVFPGRLRMALAFAGKAGMLFVGTLLILATAVPMNGATMMFSLVPFAAPLAYLMAVCPLLLRRTEPPAPVQSTP